MAPSASASKALRWRWCWLRMIRKPWLRSMPPSWGFTYAGLQCCPLACVAARAGWLELYRPSQLAAAATRSAVAWRCVCGGAATPSVLEAWLAQAISLGAQQLDAPRIEAFGSEVWMLDPEGNGLLLLVSDS